MVATIVADASAIVKAQLTPDGRRGMAERMTVYRGEAARRRRDTLAGRKAYAAMHAQTARRVVACSLCGRTAEFRGYLWALRQGWVWTWRRAREVWICDDEHGSAAVSA